MSNNLRVCVQMRRDQFRYYQQQHRYYQQQHLAKTPPDTAKARVNEALALICENALALDAQERDSALRAVRITVLPDARLAHVEDSEQIK
jgi:hypothetical protein